MEDFHSHFRWFAIRRYVDLQASRTLEVGAGNGLVTFAIAKQSRQPIEASELDSLQAAEAEKVAKILQVQNVRISQSDLRKLNLVCTYDQILAIDVLEHIDDDGLALELIARALRPGGRLLVSVPTPLYPRYFGREFADSIGHVRDGYWLEDLEPKLQRVGLKVQRHHYYTRRWVAQLASLYYGGRLRGAPGAMLHPPLRPVLRLAEGAQDPRFSCGLAVLAIKSA